MPSLPIVPDDLLKRRDAPPDGVAALADFFLGGGGFCPTRPGLSGPAVILEPGGQPIELPTDLSLCFHRFEVALPLSVTITGPDGRVESHDLVLTPGMPSLMPFALPYPRLSGDPVGIHRVSARQGDQIASLDFVVEHARQPRMLLLDPPEDELTVGIDLHFYLGGFPPEQPTTVHLYGSAVRGETQPYRTSFTAPVDRHGETHIVLDTKPDDPPGCYGLLSQLVLADDEHPYPGFCLNQHS